MGDGPVQWTAIETYAQVSEFDEEQSWLLHIHITEMDQEYLKYLERKRKKH